MPEPHTHGGTDAPECSTCGPDLPTKRKPIRDAKHNHDFDRECGPTCPRYAGQSVSDDPHVRFKVDTDGTARWFYGDGDIPTYVSGANVMTWTTFVPCVFYAIGEEVKATGARVDEQHGWSVVVHPHTWGDLMTSEDKPEVVSDDRVQGPRVFGLPIWTDRSVKPGEVRLRYERIARAWA